MGERKKTRKALAILKRAAVTIAIFDLILTISDSRTMGRFFLLLSMSTSFDITPENVVRDYCEGGTGVRRGICETYKEMMDTGTISFPSEMNGRHPPNKDPSQDTADSRNLMKTTFSMQRLPDMLKELVTNWKSTLDFSRSETNISFYFDEEGEGGEISKSRSSKDNFPVDLNPSNKSQTKVLNSFPNLNGNQRKGGESGSGTAQAHLNSNARLVHHQDQDNLINRVQSEIHHPVESQSADRRKGAGQPEPEPEPSSKGKESNPSHKRKVMTGSNTKDNGATLEWRNPISGSTTWGKTTSSLLGESGDHDHFIKKGESKNKGKPLCDPDSFPNCHQTEEEGQEDENQPTLCRHQSSPKKLLGLAIQEELFGRWEKLVKQAEDLIAPGPGNEASCTGSHLNSPEATLLRMQVQLSPFGGAAAKESERRVKALQQTLFDHPWLTVIQLYNKLSGGFIKVFVVISLYTWVWGTVLALLLLMGSLAEDPTIIHGWIIFNILYSFLFFMIDDWIHTNINPVRSTLSIWLSICYSLYKPVATWVVLMQWSEMKKLLSPLTPEEEKNGSSPCLKHGTMKLMTSNSNQSPESTIVDLNVTDLGGLGCPSLLEKESNTSAALLLAASKLRDKEEHVEEDCCDSDEEEDDNDNEDTDSDSDQECDPDSNKDLERGDSDAKILICPGEKNCVFGVRNLGYVVKH